METNQDSKGIRCLGEEEPLSYRRTAREHPRQHEDLPKLYLATMAREIGGNLHS